MVKITDHQQTGKRKFIRGPGRKKDIPLELLDLPKNKEEVRADRFLDVVPKLIEDRNVDEEILKLKEEKEKLKLAIEKIDNKIIFLSQNKNEKKNVVIITDRISKAIIQKHYEKVSTGKKFKNFVHMYRRYGNFNRKTLTDFLKRRLNGQKEFEFYG